MPGGVDVTRLLYIHTDFATSGNVVLRVIVSAYIHMYTNVSRYVYVCDQVGVVGRCMHRCVYYLPRYLQKTLSYIHKVCMYSSS